MQNDEALQRAARAVRDAEALVICAGAGMGVDSGLPDFRGNDGFWNAYPPYRHLNVSFAEMANPTWFDRDPAFAWGFYGHRRNLYRSTNPHGGFAILLNWARQRQDNYFVFTSNVDNQFQKAGFDPERIVECHGAIEWNQCTRYCDDGIFPAGPEQVSIDMATMRALEPLPSCPRCGALARPNILMFGDFEWISAREREQDSRLTRWLSENKARRGVIVECGAGTRIATVRYFSESITGALYTLIRINPREPEAPEGQIGLALGSIEALSSIDRLIGTL